MSLNALEFVKSHRCRLRSPKSHCVVQFLSAYMRKTNDPRTPSSKSTETVQDKAIRDQSTQLPIVELLSDFCCHSYIKGLLGGPTPAEHETLRQENEDLKQQLGTLKQQLEDMQAKVQWPCCIAVLQINAVLYLVLEICLCTTPLPAWLCSTKNRGPCLSNTVLAYAGCNSGAFAIIHGLYASKNDVWPMFMTHLQSEYSAELT